MNETSQSIISLRDIFRISFRHKWKAIPAFGCVFGLAVAGAFLWPKTFESEAKLFIRIGRSSVSLDPTVTVSQSVTTSEPREREINSILEILRSRELMDKVADEIKPTEILGPRFDLMSSLGVTAAPAPTEQETREKAARELERSLSSGVSKNSNVIRIRCQARSPQLAQAILSAYIKAFTDHHLRLNRTSGSYAFFVSQIEQTKIRMEEAERALRDAKNRVGIGSVEGQTKLIEQQVTNLQQDLTNTSSAVASAEAKLTSLREQCPDTAEAVTSEATGGSSATAIDNMRTELYRLQIHKRELLAKLSHEHPRVLAVQEQERQARRLLAQQEYLTEKMHLRSLTARVEELTQNLEKAHQRFLKLNEDTIRIGALKQRVSGLRASYQKYVENRELARIDGELESERISNVNVAQAPTFVSKPVSPDKAMVLVVGMVGGLFLAISMTLVSEYFDDSFQTPDQVERVLDLPVVMTIRESRGRPYIWAVRKEETTTNT
ncbi:MAG: GumC family protein [Pirellulaceae bacterium]